VNPISRFIHLGIFLLFLASAGIACASDSSEPPGRVVYLQYMAGEVSVQPHGIEAWIPGSIFRPLTNADNVWADQDSRAELNLGSGRIRIDSETSLTLTKVTDRSVQVELHQGVVNLHVRRLGDGEIYKIDTPNLAFTFTEAGDYRVDVSPNEDSTVVTVRQGEGQATGHERAVSVHSGERTEFGGNSLAHPVREAPREDGFDKWCQDRDRRFEHAASASSISHSPVGDDDVEQYRAWREAYGPVWAPTTVAPVWLPYPNVYWISVKP
jgi:FecR protein